MILAGTFLCGVLFFLHCTHLLAATAHVCHTDTHKFGQCRHETGKECHNGSQASWQRQCQREESDNSCLAKSQSTGSEKAHEADIPCNGVNADTNGQRYQWGFRPESKQ